MFNFETERKVQISVKKLDTRVKNFNSKVKLRSNWISQSLWNCQTKWTRCLSREQNNDRFNISSMILIYNHNLLVSCNGLHEIWECWLMTISIQTVLYSGSYVRGLHR